MSAGSRSQTLGEMILDAAARFDGVALQYRRDGQTVDGVIPGAGCDQHRDRPGPDQPGHRAGDRVAILGLTSADWTLADCGSLCAGAVVTPIYHTNSPEECAYVLDHSQARLVFCDDAAQLAKIEQIRDRCPMLEHVVTFKPAGEEITLRRAPAAGPRDPAGASPRAGRLNRARRRRDARLHLRHDRAAQGLHAQPRELHRRPCACTSSGSGSTGRTRCISSCHSRTCSRASPRPWF